MADIPSLLRQLQDPKANKRFDACELLRVAPALSPEAISALQVAADDTDPYVRESAKSALAVHLPSVPQALPPVIRNPELQARMQTPAEMPVMAVPPPMPNTAPNSPEYIFALERRLMVAEEEVRRLTVALQQTTTQTNQGMSKLPSTALLSKSFLTRAFAVWGHFFVAQLMIAVPIYCIIFLIASTASR